MRPLITALDVDAMEWKALGPPGLHSKLLSRDQETGARTALQRMVPSEGYVAPKVAHYHHTYEELLGVYGRFTFDGTRWVVPQAYLFHPPLTVHGFQSNVPEESWFLSRVGRDLDVNLVPEPTGNDIYPIDGVAPPRAAAAMGDPPAERGWTPYTWGTAATPVSWCALSVDPASGEGTAFLRVPKDWSTTLPVQVNDTYLELFVLDGALEIDGVAYGRHFYGFVPPGRAPKKLASVAGGTAYVNFGGPTGITAATH